MAERAPRKWPYSAAKPSRMKRVVRVKDDAPKGVRRRELKPAEPPITPFQARIALLALVLMAVTAGGWWAYQSPWLTIGSVSVAGTETVSAQDVRRAAALDGKSTFTADLAAARARIEALPGVKSATVEKRGWNAVSVIIHERQPWGSWQVDGVNVPVDDEGVVLTRPAAPGSPVIIEDHAHRSLQPGDHVDAGAVQLATRLVRDADQALGRTLRVMVYQQDRGVTVALAGKGDDSSLVWATFGDVRDYDYKLAALYVLLQETRENDVPLVQADLRFGERLSFR